MYSSDFADSDPFLWINSKLGQKVSSTCGHVDPPYGLNGLLPGSEPGTRNSTQIPAFLSAKESESEFSSKAKFQSFKQI